MKCRGVGGRGKEGEGRRRGSGDGVVGIGSGVRNRSVREGAGEDGWCICPNKALSTILVSWGCGQLEENTTHLPLGFLSFSPLPFLFFSKIGAASVPLFRHRDQAKP